GETGFAATSKVGRDLVAAAPRAAPVATASDHAAPAVHAASQAAVHPIPGDRMGRLRAVGNGVPMLCFGPRWRLGQKGAMLVMIASPWGERRPEAALSYCIRNDASMTTW